MSEAPVAPKRRFAIIIPARYESSRYPGKPLALLRGAGGEARPLIRRTWECARAITENENIWVATDDERIADAVRGFSAQVVMTSRDCRNGTERCAEAIASLGDIAGIVVNLQGDAPLTPTFVVEGLVEGLANDGQAAMATAAVACSKATYQHLIADQAAGRVGGTTVVMNSRSHALYFSKRVIPYLPGGRSVEGHRSVFLHLGVYAYRPAALASYAATLPSTLEELEGLEQLRFLEGDSPIRVVAFGAPDWDCIELNNPEDVPAIEAALVQRGIA